MVLSSAQVDFLPIEVLHYGNREFRAFLSCDLDFDPVNFIYEFDTYPVKVSPQTKNELSTSKLWKLSY